MTRALAQALIRWLVGPDEMESYTRKRAVEAAIRYEMDLHQAESRAYYPPDEIKAEPDRLRELWRRELEARRN